VTAGYNDVKVRVEITLSAMGMQDSGKPQLAFLLPLSEVFQ
jgi:hypothetical protein